MARKKRSFAEVLNATDVMEAGIRKHLDKLTRRGIDEAFVENFKKLKESVRTQNNEQESLKAQLKKKTDLLYQEFDKLTERLSECRKLVKLDIDQELWKEFGIQDIQ
jgi:flagellar capping protein FliD